MHLLLDGEHLVVFVGSNPDLLSLPLLNELNFLSSRCEYVFLKVEKWKVLPDIEIWEVLHEGLNLFRYFYWLIFHHLLHSACFHEERLLPLQMPLCHHVCFLLVQLWNILGVGAMSSCWVVDSFNNITLFFINSGKLFLHLFLTHVF